MSFGKLSQPPLDDVSAITVVNQTLHHAVTVERKNVPDELESKLFEVLSANLSKNNITVITTKGKSRKATHECEDPATEAHDVFC